MTKEQNAKILLVDDRTDNLLALEAVLQDPTYNLIKVQSGEDALRFLLEENVDLILLDVHMPGIDGFETARLIADRKKTRHIPIIFITGKHKAVDDIVQGYALSAVDYIVKPIDPQALRAKVAMLIELGHRTAEIH